MTLTALEGILAGIIFLMPFERDPNDFEDVDVMKPVRCLGKLIVNGGHDVINSFKGKEKIIKQIESKRIQFESEKKELENYKSKAEQLSKQIEELLTFNKRQVPEQKQDDFPMIPFQYSIKVLPELDCQHYVTTRGKIKKNLELITRFEKKSKIQIKTSFQF